MLCPKTHIQKLIIPAATCGAFLLLASVPVADAAEWLTAPSYYTHDRTTGQRTTQYAQIGPFYYYQRADYMKSGYRQNRSTIQLGGSADNLHVVEEWGNPVRPYEEWRFPFRPYSAPYDAWGPPYGGLGGFAGPGYGAGYGGTYGGGYGGASPYGGGGFGPGGGPGPGGPGGGPGPGGPGGGPGPGGGGGYQNRQSSGPQPWVDGYYPSYDRNDRSHYYDPYPSRPETGGGPTP